MWLLFEQDKKYNQYIPLQLTNNKRICFKQVSCYLHTKLGVKMYLFYKTHIVLNLCSILEHNGRFTWCCFAEEQSVLLECNFSIKAFVALFHRVFLLLLLLFLQQQQQQSSNDSYQ